MRIDLTPVPVEILARYRAVVHWRDRTPVVLPFACTAIASGPDVTRAREALALLAPLMSFDPEACEVLEKGMARFVDAERIALAWIARIAAEVNHE